MPTMSLQEEIQRARRAATVATIRGRPQTTLAELAELAHRRPASELASITVGEILGAEAPTVPRKTGRAAVNTRTQAGRERYDKAALAVLRRAHSDLSAEQIRRQIGGSALQARTALQRLIGAKLVRRSGNARATRYEVRAK